MDKDAMIPIFRSVSDPTCVTVRNIIKKRHSTTPKVHGSSIPNLLPGVVHRERHALITPNFPTGFQP